MLCKQNYRMYLTFTHLSQKILCGVALGSILLIGQKEICLGAPSFVCAEGWGTRAHDIRPVENRSYIR